MNRDDINSNIARVYSYKLYDVLDIITIYPQNDLMFISDPRDKMICQMNPYYPCNEESKFPSKLKIPKEGNWRIVSADYIINGYDFNYIFIDKSLDEDFYNYVENKINCNEIIFPGIENYNDIVLCIKAQGATITGATLPSGLKIPSDGVWVVVRNFIIRTNNKDEIDSNFYYNF